MNEIPLILAGSLGLLGAAVHGFGGELLVVRRLSTEQLPASRLGSPRMTMTMIHVTWHMTTIAFATVGCALLVAGAFADGDSARGVAWVATAAATGFAALALGLGGAQQSPRGFFRHPGPLALTATAALAWWGVL